jgi:hypothetical protein
MGKMIICFKDKYRKYAVGSLFTWIIHVIIFYSFIIFRHTELNIDLLNFSAWSAGLRFHILIVLLFKEYLTWKRLQR